jgi:hypothetical protein
MKTKTSLIKFAATSLLAVFTLTSFLSATPLPIGKTLSASELVASHVNGLLSMKDFAYDGPLQVRNGKSGDITVEVASEPRSTSEQPQVFASVRIPRGGSVTVNAPADVLSSKRVAYRITFYGSDRQNNGWSGCWIDDTGGNRSIYVF